MQKRNNERSEKMKKWKKWAIADGRGVDAHALNDAEEWRKVRVI